uniref:Cytochrome P450 oxidase CYP749A86 n=1 Tax=Polygala tenuifolia TaxID=355332 RepID=A0A3G5ANK1_9FABA|nr:cytochrome P450 oxidase CYP749A86 [Polygala tenuifolia]
MYFLYCLFLLLVCAFLKVLHKFWWIPSRIHHHLNSQGIRGPQHKFLYGNGKEILQMRKEAMESPMELSHDIFSKVHPYFYTCINTYGKKFLIWLGPQPQLIVTEQDMIKEILNNKEKSYPKQEVWAYVKKLLGEGSVTSEGEKWTKMRKVANIAFHGDILKRMVPDTISVVEMMLERWKEHEGKEMEVSEEFRLLTSEMIARTAFGSNYLEGKNIFDMLTQLAVLISRNALKFRLPGISKFYKTSDDIESDKLVKEIHVAILEVIKKREAKMAGGVIDTLGSDFLGLLLKAHHDADIDSRISVQDMVDECKTMYFAGQETTTSMLAWTVFLLALHTDWQEKARNEVFQICGHNHPCSDDIAKLKTMALIINESLRLYPPVLGLDRESASDVRLGGLVLKAKTWLYIPILALHSDPKIWGKDVHQFRPDRFSEGVAKATNYNTAAYFPFGIGPRYCVGFNVATTEAKFALSMILQRYRFTLSPSYVHSPFQLMTLKPQHGIQIILRPLEKQ